MHRCWVVYHISSFPIILISRHPPFASSLFGALTENPLLFVAPPDMVNCQLARFTSDRGLERDITFVMLGLYGWSYINSCQVESALLRRQLPFRWRMVSTCMVFEFDAFLQVPYLIGRTCFLVTLILSLVRLRQYSVLSTIADVFKSLAFSGNIVVVCTSTNLVIRFLMNHSPSDVYFDNAVLEG
ncbi:uncharacterized protein F5147DRAFT_127151 [Suillus discolor]|uniref:Uncharacterized protein n=1 Tax=Suillus discolor TaxID=1912936 RepID=A0A9P7JUX0_9AGAM|nr:uncharacterized protein F5147DRAFT_127151 [Suillus discolor]KAG2110523.1 hypothetical protein F5147DRAFT_127151 [Suillus discolor]